VVTRSGSGGVASPRSGSGGVDGTLKTWDPATGELLHELSTGLGKTCRAVFTKDGKRIKAINNVCAMKEWDSTDFRELSSTPGTNPGNAKGRSAILESDAIASNEKDHQIALRDPTTGEIRLTLPGHGDRVTHLAISPNNRILASVSLDNTIKLWETATGNEVCTIRGSDEAVTSIAFSQDGLQIVAGGRGRQIRLWNSQTGQELQSFENPIGRQTLSLALSPDGSRLASGDIHGTISIWDVKSGQEVLEIPSDYPLVTKMAFSPDGCRLAAVFNDGTVLVWDAPSFAIAP
jgi:WD40 repeat protein